MTKKYEIHWGDPPELRILKRVASPNRQLEARVVEVEIANQKRTWIEIHRLGDGPAPFPFAYRPDDLDEIVAVTTAMQKALRADEKGRSHHATGKAKRDRRGNTAMEANE